MVRDNNVGRLGTSSNYYICNVERTVPPMRFDPVAVHWPSTVPFRKNPHGKGMTVVELKVLDSS